MDQVPHYINGQRVRGASQRLSDIYNPALGQVIRQVPLGDRADLEAAVAAAKAALPAWSNMPVARRARYMFKLLELLQDNVGEFAKIVSEEHGKVLDDAAGEIARGAEVVEFCCSMPQMMEGRFDSQIATGMDQFSMRKPLGVVAGITPFNFPIMIPLWMFPMAATCGNTFILKPSERDPSASLLLADLVKEAGIPDGVYNVLHGDKEAVDGILTHPDIKAVSFVGSTPIAHYVSSTGWANGKRVQALGGAKNHMIIMPDANMEQAADALLASAYGAAGERCMAISVAVPVGAETADNLIKAMVPRIEALKVGPGNAEGVEMGPLVNEAALDRVTGYIAKGVEEGADLVLDGRGFKAPQGYENGYFLGGSLFDNVTTDMSIYKDEIFGPVLSVVRAKSYEEARDMATNHLYGNGVALFTQNGALARDFAENVEVGMLGINVPIPVPTAWHSFGGWKASIFGDLPMFGKDGLMFWTRQKNVMARYPDAKTAMGQFNFKRSSDI